MSLRSRFSDRRLRTFAVAIVIALDASTNVSAAGQQVRLGSDDIVFVQPTRRKPASLAAPLPELLPGADAIQPLSFDVVVESRPPKGAVTTQRQAVSRTVDRIHVRVDGKEWLFERNVVDRRRVSAFLVHHTSRTIVLHEESDLRNMLGIKGWADVLMVGFDGAVLGDLGATTETRTLAGLTFRKHAAPSGEKPVSEVWWNPECLLPSKFVVRDATMTTTVSLRDIRTTVDQDLLRPPTSRFPGYKLVDVAEWLEGH